jgi:hypothetical protein
VPAKEVAVADDGGAAEHTAKKAKPDPWAIIKSAPARYSDFNQTKWNRAVRRAAKLKDADALAASIKHHPAFESFSVGAPLPTAAISVLQTFAHKLDDEMEELEYKQRCEKAAFDVDQELEDGKLDEVYDVQAAAASQQKEECAARTKALAAKRAALETELAAKCAAIQAEELKIAEQLGALENIGAGAAAAAAAPIAPAAPATTAAGQLPEIKFGTSDARTGGDVTLKVLYKREFKSRSGQPVISVSLVDIKGNFCRITYIGPPPPSFFDVGSYIAVNGVVKAPTKFCAAGFACEIQPKAATIKSVQPTELVRNNFPPDGTLPALMTGAQMGALATVSAANGHEKSVKAKVNVALKVIGPGTTFHGASCERFKTTCLLPSGYVIGMTVWEPSADTEDVMAVGMRVFGENLTLGCHDGEISLSGSPTQICSIERERCPTPAMQEAMEPFKPRALTESVMRSFFMKHNKSKLENPAFITSIMSLSDDEIRSKCKARYNASPEPVREDFDF